MKKFLFILFVLISFTPLYAQHQLKSAAKLIQQGRLLRADVSYLSHRANADFAKQIEQGIAKATISQRGNLKQGHVTCPTFQLQYTASPFAPTASGFAIDLLNNGKVWGVTAGHVARKIIHSHAKKSRNPHIKVQIEPHTFIIAPIEKFFFGNPEGIDVALFEIPKEVLPYVKILHPAQHVPSMGQEVTIQGFVEEQNKPVTVSGQKVLFSTPVRFLLSKTFTENVRGLCGSPGSVEGRVSMVYIGFDSAPILSGYDWFNKLPKETKVSMSNLDINYAIPIDIIKAMAQNIEENGSTNNVGIMMKILGHPVALLHPNESIVSIEQFRNGEKIEKIDVDRHFSIDPEQLEIFFELQERDILRISIASFSLQHPFPPVSIVYDVDVSTGQVTTPSK